MKTSKKNVAPENHAAAHEAALSFHATVAEHPFFGMKADVDVEKEMDNLRGGRYRDI